MLPLTVFAGLTKFAKEEACSGVGKFDYGLAIKLLLERNETYKKMEEIYKRIEYLEDVKGGRQ